MIGVILILIVTLVLVLAMAEAIRVSTKQYDKFGDEIRGKDEN